MTSENIISVFTFGDVPNIFGAEGETLWGGDQAIVHVDCADGRCPSTTEGSTNIAIFTAMSRIKPTELFSDYPTASFPFLVYVDHSMLVEKVNDLQKSVSDKRIVWTINTVTAFDWINLTDAFVEQIKCFAGNLLSRKDHLRVKIALQEAVSNAIIHGNLGISSITAPPYDGDIEAFYADIFNYIGHPRAGHRNIELSVEMHEKHLQITVRDDGDSITLPEMRPKGSTTFSGRGIHLMRVNSDSFSIRQNPSRVLLGFNCVS